MHPLIGQSNVTLSDEYKVLELSLWLGATNLKMRAHTGTVMRESSAWKHSDITFVTVRESQVFENRGCPLTFTGLGQIFSSGCPLQKITLQIRTKKFPFVKFPSENSSRIHLRVSTGCACRWARWIGEDSRFRGRSRDSTSGRVTRVATDYSTRCRAGTPFHLA